MRRDGNSSTTFRAPTIGGLRIKVPPARHIRTQPGFSYEADSQIWTPQGAGLQRSYAQTEDLYFKSMNEVVDQYHRLLHAGGGRTVGLLQSQSGYGRTNARRTVSLGR